MLMWSERDEEKNRVVFVFRFEERMHLSARATESRAFGCKWGHFFCKMCLRSDNDWMDEGRVPASSTYTEGLIGSL